MTLGIREEDENAFFVHYPLFRAIFVENKKESLTFWSALRGLMNHARTNDTIALSFHPEGH